jgi:hypothetical protein
MKNILIGILVGFTIGFIHKSTERRRVDVRIQELLFEKFKEQRKENLKLHVPLIELNSIVDDCWSCKRIKKGKEELSNALLELGQKN